jgi:signal transduction protein with GAF and PtsI domain
MNLRGRHAPAWAIWALVGAVAAIQVVVWMMDGVVARRPGVLVQMLAAWVVILVLAVLATRRIGALSARLSRNEQDRLTALNEVEQLQTQNVMLQTIARSVDVPLAFQTLATRIARIVPCDRMGLALISENGQEFQTYTARVQEQERRARPRPELVFKVDRTALGTVLRTREPLLLDDLAQSAPDFLDVNVLHSAGFQSMLMMPLVSKGRAVGTLNVVSRAKQVFNTSHAKALESVAEILAVAHVAQQLQVAVGKYRSTEAMAELTLSISAEINSALQTIIGHCDLLERGYPDPALQRDLATVIRQAQRISGLLEKLRASAHDRMREVSNTVAQGGIPTSPEAYDRETR